MEHSTKSVGVSERETEKSVAVGSDFEMYKEKVI